MSKLPKKLLKQIVVWGVLVIAVPAIASASEWGLVILADVCGPGNAVILDNEDLYVTAEHYSGVYLLKGDEIQGKLKEYGFGTLTRKLDDVSGEFFIQACYNKNLDDAVKALCR